MKRYIVSLRGENLLIRNRGEARKYGFRTKRCVEAPDEEAAEIKSLGLIFNDRNLQQSIFNRDSDPPTIAAEEIKEIQTPDEQNFKDLKIEYYEEDV